MVVQLHGLFYGSMHREEVVLSLNFKKEAFLLCLWPVGM